MIYLEPTGGLANRIRVISSGIKLKNELHAELIIIWNENYELRCPYDNIFEPSTEYTVLKKKRVHGYVTRSNQQGYLKKKLTALTNRLLGVNYCFTEEDSLQTDFNAAGKRYKTIYIKTCEQFNSATNEFQLFKPIKYIVDQKNSVKKLFSEKTVGVQIRRSDNALSIKHSPLGLFVTKINEIITQENDVSFFLSTDDPATELELQSMFNNRMISHKKEFSRQTVKGIQDAVVDLFLLSETTYILGSYYSSFSEVAACIGGVPLHVITEQSKLFDK